jgi:hypothetical protein
LPEQRRSAVLSVQDRSYSQAATVPDMPAHTMISQLTRAVNGCASPPIRTQVRHYGGSNGQ